MDDLQILPAVIFLLVLQVVYLGTFYIFYRFKSYELIHRRLPNFVLICTLANMLATDFFAINLFPRFQTLVPCFVDLWFYYLMMPLWMYLNLIRDLHIMFLHYLNQARFIASDGEGRSGTAGVLAALNPFDRVIFKVCRWLRIFLKRNWISKPGSGSFYSKNTNSSSNGSSSGAARRKSNASQASTAVLNNLRMTNNDVGSKHLSAAGGSMGNESHYSINDSITRLSSFNLTDIFKLIFMIVLVELAFLIAVSIFFPSYTPVQMDFHPYCKGMPYNALFILILIYIFVKLCFLIALRQIKDTFHYRIESVLGFITLVSTFAMFYTNVPAYVLGDSNSYPIFWCLVGTIILHLLNVIMPLVLAIIDASSKSRVGTSDSKGPNGVSTFEQVMADPVLYKKLKKVMASTFCLENILFHEEYLEFSRELVGNRTISSTSLAGNSSTLRKQSSSLAMTSSPAIATTSNGGAPTSTIIAAAINNNSSGTNIINAFNPNVASANAKTDVKIKGRMKAFLQKYVQENSPYELNISSGLRTRFIETFAADPGDLSVLDQVHNEVLTLIHRNSYPRLLNELKAEK